MSEVRTTLEMTGVDINIVEVIEETLRIETGHTIDAEAGIKLIVEDLEEVEERVDLGNRDRSNSRDKNEKRKCHFCRESGLFMRRCQKKRDHTKQGQQKTQM